MAIEDMSWLIEASRKAQEKRQQFASPSISQHIPTGFTGLAAAKEPAFKMPLSPKERAGQIIEQMRQEQAQRPVVPTISGKRLMEELRKQQEAEKRAQEEWEYQLERDKLADERYEKEWEYKVAQDAIANALKAKAASGTGTKTTKEDLYNPLEPYPWLTTENQQREFLNAVGGQYISNFINDIIADGGSWKDIKSALDSPAVKTQLAAHMLNDTDALQIALERYEQAINSMIAQQRPIPVGASKDPISFFGGITQRVDWSKKYLNDLEKARKEVMEALLKAPIQKAEQEKTVERYSSTFIPSFFPQTNLSKVQGQQRPRIPGVSTR